MDNMDNMDNEIKHVVVRINKLCYTNYSSL